MNSTRCKIAIFTWFVPALIFFSNFMKMAKFKSCTTGFTDCERKISVDQILRALEEAKVQLLFLYTLYSSKRNWVWSNAKNAAFSSCIKNPIGNPFIAFIATLNSQLTTSTQQCLQDKTRIYKCLSIYLLQNWSKRQNTKTFSV